MKLFANRTVSVTPFLIATFGSVLAIAIIIEVRIALITAEGNTSELLRDKAEVTLSGIESRVHAILKPVAAQGLAITRMARADDNVGDDSTQAFAYGTLSASPQVQSMTIIVVDGATFEYSRSSDGIQSSEHPYTQRDKQILALAQRRGYAFWDEPRNVNGEVVIEHVSPAIAPSGQLLGVLVQRVAASTISRSLVRVVESEQRETPFVLVGPTEVLAHPLLIAGNLNVPESDNRMPKLADIGDAILESIWSANELPVLTLKPTKGVDIKGRRFGGKPYLFIFRTIDDYGSTPWTVGAYLDGDSTEKQVERIAFTVISGAILLIVSVFVAFLIGRRAAAPAVRLAAAAELVRQGRLDEIERLPATRLREFNHASQSFNQMVEGIKERDVIRDLFGKFVPERVATAMLRSPDGMLPQSTEATILFVDIASFTPLAERVGPQDLVSILNEYFSALVDVIESHDGIVTQFQGDAILAVFNVPQLVPEHAAQAVSAARKIQQTVANNTFKGERMSCRIGIATGPIIAGNVGALGRLNYTVHGDAVNLAARLEQLCKTHGTHLLIAGSTVSCITDLDFEPVAYITARGQSNSIMTYTIN